MGWPGRAPRLICCKKRRQRYGENLPSYCNRGNAGNRRRRIDWWGDLPPPMKEAIEQFRTQFGAAIDSKLTTGKALHDVCCAAPGALPNSAIASSSFLLWPNLI
jgi:hypothetical protein